MKDKTVIELTRMQAEHAINTQNEVINKLLAMVVELKKDRLDHTEDIEFIKKLTGNNKDTYFRVF